MKAKKSKQREHKDKILNEIPIFLAKTYRIVDNPEYAESIQWLPSENGFVVKNITELTQKIFPKHFKHTNYASFVRQLNLYGFHKVRSNDDGQIFTHSYFQKNNPDLLPLIKRKNTIGKQSNKPEKPQVSSQLALINSSPSNLIVMPNQQSNNNQQLQKQLGMLTQKHQSLQNLVSVLVEQNKQIILQNKSFINKINSLDDNYRKKLQTLIFLMVFGLKNGDSNIIVPPQLNHMIKAFTSSKKQKKSKNNNGNTNMSMPNNQNSSQAVQLFKRPSQDQNRFANKKIQQILQMLTMQGEVGQSQNDDSKLQLENQFSNKMKFQKRPSIAQIQSSDFNQPPPSPINSIRSLTSRYLDNNNNRISDDWNDFLDKLEHSDLEIQSHKE